MHALGEIARPPYDGGMARILAAIVLVLAFALAPAAEARQDDPRLDALFERLLAAPEFEEARRIEASIWTIWIESGDDTLDALMSRGWVAMNVLDYDTALLSFDAIVEADPKFAEGWNKRATLFYLMERYGDSVRDVERTLELEPRHFGALSGMGLISMALGDEAAALDWFDRALEVYPHMQGAKGNVRYLREKLRGKAI